MEDGPFDTFFRQQSAVVSGKMDEDWLLTFKGDQSLVEQAREDIMEKWNGTSNDSDIMALLNQAEASEIFEVDLSTWQKSNLDRVVGNRVKAEAQGDFANQAETLRRLGSFESAGSNKFGQLPYKLRMPEEAKALRNEAMRAIYANTQETLKANGYDSLILYRGVRLDDVKAAVGEVVDLSGNTLESWTFSQDVARSFGGARGLVLKAEVPASRVFGFGSQGMGTMYESEVVVLGKQKGMIDAIEVVKGNI